MVISPIEQLVFVQVLQMSSSLLSKYSTASDRLLWLIFIPHVLLMIFIWLFADSVAKMGGGTHTGIKALVGVAAYITIITTGWYGNIIAPIFVSMWQIVLGMALLMFVASRFLHPARAKEMMAFGKFFGEKVTEKGKISKRLEHERDSVNRMIKELNKVPATTREGREAKEIQMTQLKVKLAEIEHELEES